MVETLFGSASPMWTMPAVIPFPAPMSGRPLAPPVFAPPPIVSPVGGMPSAATFSLGLNPLGGTVGPIAPDPSMPAMSLLAFVAARRGQPHGPTTDQEVEDFIYDALELLPGASEIDVRSEAGRVTLTGSVQNKRVKRDAGEIAWAIPVANDVQNNVTIASRRRARTAGRESEPQPQRKQG
jgi:hypothetical protein